MILQAVVKQLMRRSNDFLYQSIEGSRECMPIATLLPVFAGSQKTAITNPAI